MLCTYMIAQCIMSNEHFDCKVILVHCKYFGSVKINLITVFRFEYRDHSDITSALIGGERGVRKCQFLLIITTKNMLT